MKKRVVKNKKIRNFLKEGGRDGARRDFFELLKRAAKPIKSKQ